MAVTKEERADAIAAGAPTNVSDSDVIGIEELAALYVSGGGDDPRALKLVQDAKAAGRVDADGNWIDQE